MLVFEPCLFTLAVWFISRCVVWSVKSHYFTVLDKLPVLFPFLWELSWSCLFLICFYFYWSYYFWKWGCSWAWKQKVWLKIYTISWSIPTSPSYIFADEYLLFCSAGWQSFPFRRRWPRVLILKVTKAWLRVKVLFWKQWD